MPLRPHSTVPGAAPPAPGRADRLPPAAVLLLAGALTALFLAVSLTPLTNNDIWLHMANGSWILEHGHVPLTDPYSFSAAGHRFHAHEWLAGVLFHLVYLLAGVGGLIFLKTALGGLALLLVAWAARRAGAGPLALATGLLLGLVIVNSRFLERPEMFSYLLTGLYLAVLTLEHERLESAPPSRRGWSLLWLLLPVQWAWVQIHGYFLTGLALVGTFLAAETARQIWLRRTVPTGRLLAGWTALAAMTLIGLANPNGLEIFLFPFRLAGGDNLFMQTVFEWKATFTTGPMTRSSMFLAFAAWLALITVCALDRPPLLRRRGLWGAVGAAGLQALLGVRGLLAADLDLPAAADRLGLPQGLAPAPPSAATGLPASAWLWSPAELLGSLSGSPGLQSAAAALMAPLRLAGGWGDDVFTLVWLALAIWLLLAWRRSSAPGLGVLATLLAFVLLLAGRWAVPILLVTVAPALATMAWRRRLPLWQAAASGLFLALAVRQNRNIVNFALVTLPVLAPALSRLSAALAAARASPAPSRRPAAAAAALTVITLGLTGLTLAWGWPYTPRVTKKVGLGVGARIPVAAVEYIRRSGISGQVFNKYAYGAYLIHQLFPDTRVFMDSRNGVYGEELYRLYLNALSQEAVAARVFARYRFDYVLVDYEFFPETSPDTGLFGYLRSRPEWVLVYFDDTSVLYLRDSPEHAALIARDGYRTLDPVSYAPGVLARSAPSRRAAFQRESLKALERRPQDRASRLLRVEALLAAGLASQARSLLAGVLADEPNDIYSLVTAARLDAAAGDLDAARARYRRVLELRPALDDVRRELERLPGSGP